MFFHSHKTLLLPLCHKQNRLFPFCFMPFMILPQQSVIFFPCHSEINLIDNSRDNKTYTEYSDKYEPSPNFFYGKPSEFPSSQTHKCKRWKCKNHHPQSIMQFFNPYFCKCNALHKTHKKKNYH